MTLSVSHDRTQETAESKARWFQSLSLTERMDYLCAITDLILENNPHIARRPLDVPGVELGVSTEKIVEFIREGRKQSVESHDTAKSERERLAR